MLSSIENKSTEFKSQKEKFFTGHSRTSNHCTRYKVNEVKYMSLA